MNYREKIRKAIECPQFGNETYGEWGALRYEQRVLIKRLLDELDGADNLILILKKENQELKADYGTKAQVERDLLMEENQELKEQFETGEQQYNRLVEEKEELQEQLSSITFQLEKQKEILDRIKKVCNSVPHDWSVCGIDVVNKIEKVLKEVE